MRWDYICCGIGNGQKGSRIMIIRVEYQDRDRGYCVRLCIYLGHDRYLVKDQEQNGSERLLMAAGQPYHDYHGALKLMEEVLR